ncbi:hypothetical protein [Nostoc sp.]|uniref:hypothetical protein n=1 Tax=Nostoc sp. TaxID=1180 RepID=UPI003FA5E37C
MKFCILFNPRSLRQLLTPNRLDPIHASQWRFCNDLNAFNTTYTTHTKFKRDDQENIYIAIDPPPDLVRWNIPGLQ